LGCTGKARSQQILSIMLSHPINISILSQDAPCGSCTHQPYFRDKAQTVWNGADISTGGRGWRIKRVGAGYSHTTVVIIFLPITTVVNATIFRWS
jgi:hypothetical protein